MKLGSRINRFNVFLAINATLAFGTMWTTYLFIIYGFGPLIFPQYMEKMLYWSNTVQLWSLPLLMVGQNLLSRGSDQRAQETHDIVMGELAEIKQIRLRMNCDSCDGQPTL
jgi:hypothetical protein